MDIAQIVLCGVGKEILTEPATLRGSSPFLFEIDGALPQVRCELKSQNVGNAKNSVCVYCAPRARSFVESSTWDVLMCS